MYERIVVGTDGSERAGLAVEHAAALARTFGARLHLVQGCAGPITTGAALDGAPGVDPGALLGAALVQLDELANRLSVGGLEIDVFAVPHAGPAALIEVAEKVDADLIVVGNRGMTGAKRLLGSVPNSVSHQAPCSVLIVKTD